MIYFGGEEPSMEQAEAIEPGVFDKAGAITVTRLAPPSALAPMTTVYVTDTPVMLRAGPSQLEPPVLELEPGSSAVLISDPGDGWLHVQAVGSGHKGYIAGGASVVADPG